MTGLLVDIAIVVLLVVDIWGQRRLSVRVAELEDESDRRAAAEYEDPRIPRTF